MPRQTSFSAGELNPYLHGRSDRAEYAKGARTLTNFIISRDGPAVSRPGTTFVRYANDPGPRLVPFVVSDSESYVLEFGHHYIRFHRNGATLLDDGVTLAATPDTGTPLQVTTTYASGDLRTLQYAQVGSVLTITHPSYEPRTLSRDDSLVWSLSVINYSQIPAAFVDLLGTGDPVYPPYLINDGTLFSYDTQHPPREWRWVVTATLKELATGKTLETLPTQVNNSFDGSTDASRASLPLDGKVVLYPDRPVTLRSFAFTFPAPAANPYALTHEIISYNYYRGRGGLLGFVGSTQSVDFVDTGAEPDYAAPPPTGESPYLSGDWPVSVGFFQERRVYGGTANRPITVLASATANYLDFDKHILSVPGQALEFELATRYRERTRWVLGQRQLLIGTDASIWSVSGGDTDVLDYDALHAHVIDNVGTTGLQPVVIGNAVFFVRAKGRGVRALLPGQGGYEPRDVSEHARHLFVGGEVSGVNGESQLETYGHTRQIVDWAYAEDPWGVLWAVRDDGVLLSMTVASTGEIGWTQHETNGFVLGVCVVPEDGEDGVYLLVRRTKPADASPQDAAVYVERMTSRVANDSAEDDACVDCCLRFKTSAQLTYTGLDHLEGLEVYAVSVGNVPYGPFVVTAGAITLPELPTPNDVDVSDNPTQVVMFIGLLFTPEIETLDYVAGPETRMRQKTVSRVGFEVNRSRGLYLGQDFEHLVEWRQRSVSGGYGATSEDTDTQSVAVSGTYDKFARAVLRQALPLPVTVLAIVREVDFGG